MLRKVAFMLVKLQRDIKTKFTLATNSESSEKLNKYYLEFLPNALNKLLAKEDENGVPLCNSYIDVEDDSLHYYPISIGQFALAKFHQYIETGEKEYKEHFLRIADWFYHNRSEDKELGVYWLSQVPKPEYKVFAPWKSAFSQSRGLSVLLRAWQISGKTDYLDVCKKALKVFELDISEGGVSVDRASDEVFFEEYVAAKPTRVLDGHLFALFGLYDFVRAVPHEIDAHAHNKAKLLFEEGYQGLIKQLPKFDMGYWMLFNRCDLDHYPKTDPCTIGYIRLVNAQLKVLNGIKPHKVLEEFIRKTERYDKLISIIRMYFHKFKALKKLNRL